MSKLSLKINSIHLTVFAIVVFGNFTSFYSQCNPSDENLKAITSILGDFSTENCTARLHNSEVGLKLRFDSDGSLIHLSGDLTAQKSEGNDAANTLLKATGEIRPIGLMLRKGEVSVITNSRTFITDMYQNAIVVRRIRMAGASKITEVVCIEYFRPLQGRIESKRKLPLLFTSGFGYEFSLDGNRFLTTAQEYRRGRIGSSMLARVAGPLDCTSQ